MNTTEKKIREKKTRNVEAAKVRSLLKEKARIEERILKKLEDRYNTIQRTIEHYTKQPETKGKK